MGSPPPPPLLPTSLLRGRARFARPRRVRTTPTRTRGSGSVAQGIIAGLVVAAFLVVAAYRQSRERRVSPVGMWITPAIFLILTAAILAVDHLSSPLAVAAVVLAVALGIPVGIAQGSHCTVEVDRSARRITYKANPIAIAILLAALGFRFGVKMATGSLASPHPLTASAALASTLALGLAVGMVIGLRIHLQRQYSTAALPSA
ncbi:DUF1453 family protein [bacterium]|nr:MAG: DUF1453 family protein [bacterium]